MTVQKWPEGWKSLLHQIALLGNKETTKVALLKMFWNHVHVVKHLVIGCELSIWKQRLLKQYMWAFLYVWSFLRVGPEEEGKQEAAV